MELVIWIFGTVIALILMGIKYEVRQMVILLKEVKREIGTNNLTISKQDQQKKGTP